MNWNEVFTYRRARWQFHRKLGGISPTFRIDFHFPLNFRKHHVNKLFRYIINVGVLLLYLAAAVVERYAFLLCRIEEIIGFQSTTRSRYFGLETNWRPCSSAAFWLDISASGQSDRQRSNTFSTRLRLDIDDPARAIFRPKSEGQCSHTLMASLGFDADDSRSGTCDRAASIETGFQGFETVFISLFMEKNNPSQYIQLEKIRMSLV